MHPTVVPALDDLVGPPAARPRSGEPMPALPPLPPGVSEPPPEPKRRRITPIRAITLLALTIACAVGGYLISQRDSGTPSSARETPTPVQRSSNAPSAPVAPPAAERPVDNRTLYPKDVAFVSSGVRFTVVPDPIAVWARAVVADEPGGGLRWQLVSVLYRNLSHEGLLAEDLRLRLKDGANNVFAPLPGVGNGGSDLAAQTPIPVGTLVKGHLAFQVPTGTANLSLIIDPGATTRARVRLESG